MPRRAKHSVPDEVRAGIAACTDIDQLDAWICRAATAEKIEGVLP